MTSRAAFEAAQAGRADTIVSRFLDRAARDPERTVFTVFPMGALNSLGTLNWGDWATRARAFAGSLLAMRLEQGARVAIFSSNRELWPIAALGAAMAGTVSVGIAPDAEQPEMVAQLGDCDPAVVVVDSLARLKQVRAAQAELRKTFTMVCDDLEPLRSSTAESLFEWELWLRDGALALQQYEPLRARLTERIETASPHDVVTISYKPGTSVGVMHSHEAVVRTATAISDRLAVTLGERLTVEASFSNPLERAVGLFVPIFTGSSAALVEHAGDAMHAARLHQSTIVCGSEGMLDELSHKLSRTRMNHENLREAAVPLLGETCRLLLCATNGMVIDVGADLHTAGIALATVYGTVEQVCICHNGPNNWQPDSPGATFPDVEVRLSEVNELEVRRGVMTSVGYFQREREFHQQLTDDGRWIRTGDRFELVNKQSLRFVGHIGDVLRLPHGAATNALGIEAALCELPHVAHAVCYGAPDQFLVAVLSLRRKELEAWALKRGVVAPWTALVDHPLVYEELARGIAEINASRALHERVAAFAPTDLEFSVHTGELDFRGQLDRPAVLARFEHVFADLHNRPRY